MPTKLLSLLLVGYLCLAIRLHACECSRATICERLDQSSVIFLGEVIEGGVAPDEKSWYSESTGARLKVVEAFRGIRKTDREVDISFWFAPGMCSPNPYLRGKQVLVFADSSRGSRFVQDGGCTQSVTGEQIQEELPMVRSYFRREMKTMIFGRIAPNTDADMVEYSLATKEKSPLVGATVIAEAQGRKYEAVSDASGKYSISGLPGGAFRVRAEHVGFESLGTMPARVKKGGCVVQDFGLWAKNSIEGFVLDRQGAPVRGLNVFLQRKGSAKKFGKDAKTNIQGGFKFIRIDPGEYSVVISPAGETADSPYPRTTNAVPLQLGPTSVIDRVDFNLPPPIPVRNIRIHVTRANGQPLIEGYITCSQAEREQEAYPMTEGLSPKPDGAICRALADRSYRIRLERTTTIVTPRPANAPEALVPPGREDVEVRLQIP